MSSKRLIYKTNPSRVKEGPLPCTTLVMRPLPVRIRNNPSGVFATITTSANSLPCSFARLKMLTTHYPRIRLQTFPRISLI